MNHYKSFQLTWILMIIIPIMGWIYYLYAVQAGDNPMPETMMLVFEGLFFIILLLFYGLTIAVDDELIVLKFGIGLIRIKIRLEDVENVFTVKNPWYYGLGIKLIPHGTLYSAHGLDGIELAMKNTNKIIRIGTRDNENLKMEIERRLS